MNLSDIATATSKELVDYYNKVTGKSITKFSDRKTAESRVRGFLKASEQCEEVPEAKCAIIPVDKAKEERKAVRIAKHVESIVEEMVAGTAAEGISKPFGYEYHGLTHCPHCKIHLDNGIGVHNDEINGKKIKHDTNEYVCLACGTEFGPAIKGSQPKSEKRSAGIAESWKDKETATKRATRDHVLVEGKGEYRSVREAFISLGLPLNLHIKFRMELKAKKEHSFNDGTNVLFFKIVSAPEQGKLL